MTFVLDQITSEPIALSSDDNTDKIRKYMTFKLADYSFALPSEDIIKVVTTPPPSQGGMVSLGLVQLAQYSIQILNLSKLLGLEILNRVSMDDHDSDDAIEQDSRIDELLGAASTQNPPFLIVLRDPDETLWGIAVHEPPDLIEMTDRMLNPVPPEKRLFGALQGVSHVGSYEIEDERHTLLILDTSVLWNPQQIDATAEQLNSSEIETPLEAEPSLEIEPPIEPESSEIKPSLEIELPLELETPSEAEPSPEIEPPIEPGFLEIEPPLEGAHLEGVQ